MWTNCCNWTPHLYKVTSAMHELHAVLYIQNSKIRYHNQAVEHNLGVIGEKWSIAQKHNGQFYKSIIG